MDGTVTFYEEYNVDRTLPCDFYFSYQNFVLYSIKFTLENLLCWWFCHKTYLTEINCSFVPPCGVATYLAVRSGNCSRLWPTFNFTLWLMKVKPRIYTILIKNLDILRFFRLSNWPYVCLNPDLSLRVSYKICAMRFMHA